MMSVFGKSVSEHFTAFRKNPIYTLFPRTIRYTQKSVCPTIGQVMELSGCFFTTVDKTSKSLPSLSTEGRLAAKCSITNN